MIDTNREGAASRSSSLRSWLAVSSVAVGTFGLVTTEFLPIGLLTTIARDLGITDGQAGLLVTMPALVAAVAAPSLLLLAGRLDRKFALLILSGLLVATNVLASLAPNLVTILLPASCSAWRWAASGPSPPASASGSSRRSREQRRRR